MALCTLFEHLDTRPKSRRCVSPDSEVRALRDSPRTTESADGGPRVQERRDDDLIPDEPSLGDWVSNTPIAMSKSLARQILLSTRQEPKPFPGIWDWSRGPRAETFPCDVLHHTHARSAYFQVYGPFCFGLDG